MVEVGGPATLAQSIRAGVPGAHIALIGVLAGFSGEVPTSEAVSNNRDMVRALEGFVWRPVVDRSYHLEEIADAIVWQKSRQHFGKLCLSY
ncbi:hypothetical protein [Hyphomicrobium sulfonivorans]|uniref:hypothetical protein n=1 Tax=Hyphomicrobium sulfonivorans TaxID=121290 RepID=UPI00156F225C|nr:hypothetical protein [Hyphomicrobium sulfonivorans]MBI1651137.1 hypothetical protein [Hyphomicrobium sulfonivorans]NSL72479.1 hypothetical protein [Hyphomicrobium sulfonivorans]